MAREAGLQNLKIASAAATREEIGNDVYPPMKKALLAAGYVCEPHAARQTTRADYGQWDYLIGNHGPVFAVTCYFEADDDED